MCVCEGRPSNEIHQHGIDYAKAPGRCLRRLCICDVAWRGVAGIRRSAGSRRRCGANSPARRSASNASTARRAGGRSASPALPTCPTDARPISARNANVAPEWAGAHCPLGALSVSHIVLLTLDVGLHVGRRHQSHCMTKFLEFASPMVRRGASLDCNQTRWKLLEERQHGATLRLAADDHLASSINFVHLKHRLGD